MIELMYLYVLERKCEKSDSQISLKSNMLNHNKAIVTIMSFMCVIVTLVAASFTRVMGVIVMCS